MGEKTGKYDSPWDGATAFYRVAINRVPPSNGSGIPIPSISKEGVILDGLEMAGQQQLKLFATPNHGKERTKLLADVDALNHRYGAGTVSFATAAAQGNLRTPWLGKAELRSAAYTTNWHELWAVR